MSSLTIRQKLVDIARREIGVREVGTNTGKRVREYQAATNLTGTGWAWCAAFVCWCIKQWGKDPEVLKALGMTPAQFEKWRPKEAGVWNFEAKCKRLGLQILPENAILHTGDIMVFDMSHIGIVADDENNIVKTIEGNTNSAGSRDGGGVMAKGRPRSVAKSFIRLIS